MDRFADLPGAIQDGRDIADSHYFQSDIPAYWTYAKQYALDDHFFSTIMDPSCPNHLVTIAASSANTINNPRGQTRHAWGCDSGPFAVVTTETSHVRKKSSGSRFEVVWAAQVIRACEGFRGVIGRRWFLDDGQLGPSDLLVVRSSVAKASMKNADKPIAETAQGLIVRFASIAELAVVPLSTG